MTTPDTKLRPPEQDWPRSKIKMHLEDHGWSLSRLSIANGYARGTAAKALETFNIPVMELIIAKTIGVNPEEIWPSRYPDGVRAPRRILTKQYDYSAQRQRRTNKQEAPNDSQPAPSRVVLQPGRL
ncbi:MAG: helix-turn-helix domain-containing protein [Magnetococcales bacterium]|nr:helix-turn-helix domain-containing protein [Magnetococcales bacterium]